MPPEPSGGIFLYTRRMLARERRTIHYAGHVQGVGFRYTASSIAQSFAVQGFVQNLSDGRVMLVAEGAPAELDRYLVEVRSRLEPYIRQELTDSSAPTGEFAGFVIRH
jgi:acylphosphatase